jgi:DNA-binding MarR family transcriptional regulator
MKKENILPFQKVIHTKWIPLPDELIYDSTLILTDIRVYSYLSQFMNSSKGINYSESTIAKDLNISLSSVTKAIRHLIDKNYIEIKGKRYNNSNSYRIVPKIKQKENEEKEDLEANN